MTFVYRIIQAMYCINTQAGIAGKSFSLLAFLLLLTIFPALAQDGQISGVVYDIHQKPLQGVNIALAGLAKETFSSQEGAFSLQSVAPGTYEISFSLLGYEKKSLRVQLGPDQKKQLFVILPENVLHMPEIEITSRALQDIGTNKIDKIDLKLRPINSAQDLLKNISGLFIGQHAGGGKAEQLFLRGFHIDHRYMGKRAADEDNSMQTDSYFLLDAQLNYTRPGWELGLSCLNLLNSEWQEAVFWSASRLPHEAAPVEDFHFTPGTPLFIKAVATFFL